MFYLGQYIMSKQLYDKKQQHIVHCANDALGAVLGIPSLDLQNPGVKVSLIEGLRKPIPIHTHLPQDGGGGGAVTLVSRPVSVYGLPPAEHAYSTGPALFTQHYYDRAFQPSRVVEFLFWFGAGTSTEEEQSERRKRHKSDSISLTFDNSLSWCVIEGLRRDRGSSESSDSRSNAEVGVSGSEDSDESFSQDSDSDNFSVEFEVESIDSDAYSEHDEASVVSVEDEVYEVTIFEAEDDDSFDEDTEITEADYWKCSNCDELNPPLPRHCNRCWTLRQDWLPEPNPKPLPTKPSAAEGDAEEGLDVPDGKRARTPTPAPEPKEDSVCDSQEACSQPSTSACSNAPSSQEDVPELERFNSLEACLPPSCLEPCVICQSRPKNGCIVHGRTGHLMACYTCAKKLKNRNKLCPVCREPIQSVVLTYLS
ncbi:hypothetical protein JZ751_016067 [Albula glossodonta]|uniref:E3 ubiquitin-protein ligase Mdm2 n=1 Tax=Albula glossodonta TaxID=121402 RepID=A0A8T2NTU6_9TELE|nr:hypothetical protein JZ751_016067 [Albula glossodonta]